MIFFVFFYMGTSEQNKIKMILFSEFRNKTLDWNCTRRLTQVYQWLGFGPPVKRGYLTVLSEIGGFHQKKDHLGQKSEL
jgi:hypothetical protein